MFIFDDFSNTNALPFIEPETNQTHCGALVGLPFGSDEYNGMTSGVSEDDAIPATTIAIASGVAVAYILTVRKVLL